MFTGLVQTTGTLLASIPGVGAHRLLVAAPELAGRWQQGDSIAVNGVCLTAIPEPDPARFAVDLAEETVRRTTLAALTPGALLNLELPTPAGAPLGGHIVQGHVDSTGTLLSLRPLHADLETTDWRLTLRIPSALGQSVLSQGSLTVDGISLTIAQLHPPEPDGSLLAEIAVIPHTYRSTNLRSLLAGSPLNLETDVLARYAQRRETDVPALEWLTTPYLLANGF